MAPMSGLSSREGRAWLPGLGMAFAILASPFASAAPVGPSSFVRLVAGSLETARLEPALSGAEERELVLSLDGGRSFPVRLTAEIDPADRETTWRVPALPTAHAVLALREGGEGLEERIVATSAEFAIVPDPAAPVEILRFERGEWWTREADEKGPDLPASSLGEAAPDRWKPLGDSLEALEGPARHVIERPAITPCPADRAASLPMPQRLPARSGLSRFLPLRE